MAIGLVQSASAASSAASPTSVAPTLGANSTAGNLLVLVVCVTGTTPTITSPANWTVIRNTVNNSIANGIFVLPNNAGGITTVTVTVGGTGGGVASVLLEYSSISNYVQEMIFGNSSAGSTSVNSATNGYPPDYGELVFGATLFAAASVNSNSNTGDLINAGPTAVSTSGVPNAQIASYWGISSVSINTRLALTLGTSVAWLTQILRVISSTQGGPVTITNVGGQSGVYVGQFNQGMIGG